MMRWCCSMFKTGPITRVINSLYRNQQILTFYGIRKSESVSRSKYNRIEDNAESVKIQQQTVASPIFFWKDFDIWLYILSEKVDFNDAYRLGYDRVGCWCCPNNNQRAQFLSRIYMPEQSKKWRNFLIRFAEKIGKPDAEVYVDTGKWKARQGGNGLAAAGDVKIRFTNCTTEDHAKIYSLVRPLDDDLIYAYATVEPNAQPYRNRTGGNLLFRPVALLPFVRAAVKVSIQQQKNFGEIFGDFPQELLYIDNIIWRNTLWNSDKGTMIVNNQKLTERILLYYWDRSTLTAKEISTMKLEIKSNLQLADMEDVETLLTDTIDK